MNRISIMCAVLFALTITNSAMPEEKTETSAPADSPRHILLVRGDTVTKLNRDELQEWAKTSAPPFLIVGAAELAESDGTFDAKDCEIAMSSRQTTIQGHVGRLRFTPRSQTAILKDAKLRISVAVIGPDLKDFAKINAKTMTLDTKGYRLQCVESTTTIDFSERN